MQKHLQKNLIMAYRHSVEVLQHAWGNYRFFGNFYKIYGKKKKKEHHSFCIR